MKFSIATVLTAASALTEASSASAFSDTSGLTNGEVSARDDSSMVRDPTYDAFNGEFDSDTMSFGSASHPEEIGSNPEGTAPKVCEAEFGRRVELVINCAMKGFKSVAAVRETMSPEEYARAIERQRHACACEFLKPGDPLGTFVRTYVEDGKIKAGTSRELIWEGKGCGPQCLMNDKS